MNPVMVSLLRQYNPNTADEYLRSLREIIQHVSLIGLWRVEFFERASFYGGTALRMFHGLPRFSEDLDFSLKEADSKFSLGQFLKGIEAELVAMGFKADVELREKNLKKDIESAFVKIDTLEAMLHIQAPAPIADRLHRDARLKIKVEVDVNPPPLAHHEVRSLLAPIPIQVSLYSPSSLFAGKVHALLCRSWKSRTKGRDFFDFIWFLGMNIPCDLQHLKARMVQSGHLGNQDVLDRRRLLELLNEKFGNVDFQQAARDVLPFLSDPQSISLWSEKFFREAAEKIRAD
jgi:predicted nucleotidyltransferase component of viral defense system